MKAAHLLLIPELFNSPPNDAIIRAYIEMGITVDVFTPGNIENKTSYGESVRVHKISYTWLWIAKNIISLRWFKYSCISGTSEDPLVVIAFLRFIYRRRYFVLVDEIKAGSYRGDRSDMWKKCCKWAIRNADFCIVNDEHRITLLMEYVGLGKNSRITVYPGCFLERPKMLASYKSIRRGWGVPENAFVIGSSGGFNLTSGADWLLNSLKDITDLYSVIQPIGVSELALFLINNLEYSSRLYVEKSRLDWQEAWRQAKGFDIGLCIYTNPAPQFQKMGISSNRLCMFIAMGVPVIASRQPSFEFLEEYDCGIMVSSYTEFLMAIHEIRKRNYIMKENCDKCYREYINTKERYKTLCSYVDQLVFT